MAERQSLGEERPQVFRSATRDLEETGDELSTILRNGL